MAKKTPAPSPKEETRPGYRFTVQGQFYKPSAEAGKSAPDFFRDVTFDLPEVCQYPAGKKHKTVIKNGKPIQIVVPRILRSNVKNVALHLILRYYLLPKLRETYPGASGIRICEIVKREKIQIPLSQALGVEELAINDMNEAQLRQFHVMNDLTVHLDNYHDLADKKAAVEMEVEQNARKQVVNTQAPPALEEEVDVPVPGELIPRHPDDNNPVDGSLVGGGSLGDLLA